MNQPSLFIPTYGNTVRANPEVLPHNRSETSINAAHRKAQSGTTDADRTKIILFLLKRPEGATREEIADETGINANSVNARVHELLGNDKKFMERGGVACLFKSKEKRPTRTGTAASVVKHQKYRV